jgi:hypothetical protein
VDNLQHYGRNLGLSGCPDVAAVVRNVSFQSLSGVTGRSKLRLKSCQFTITKIASMRLPILLPPE